jgi:ribonucleoside-triphosphate reductase
VALPAKHPDVAVLHAIKVLAAGQVNCAGGQGLFNFNVFLAPYLRGLDYKQIRQLAEAVIFELNETYVSRGGQLPFVSVQLEAGIPKIWQNVPIVKAGKVGPDVYGDYEEEARLFLRAMLEEMIKGDAMGKMFIWPKPEVRLRRKWFTDSEASNLMRLAVQLSAQFGSTYYDNVIPAYRGGEDTVDCYQCCAFRLAENVGSEAYLKKLMFEDGEHFSMGGLQVVTINLPRLAYRANGDDTKLFELLARVMEGARDILLLKRKFVLGQAERGLLPFLTQRVRYDGGLSPPLCDLENLSLIIGFVGVNELVQAHTGFQLHESRDALRFGLRTIVEMERVKDRFVKETGLPFVIARTPAESCAARLAVLDLIHFKEKAQSIVKGNLKNWKTKFDEGGFTNVPVYYTNGFMVSYDAPLDLFQKIRVEEKIFPLLSGGNIFHVWLGEANPDVDALHKLNERIATRTQLGYYSYTKDLTVCNACKKVTPLLHDSCPSCQSKDVEWYSRITGYYNAVSGWNEAKKEELRRRFRLQKEKLYP